MATIKQEAEAYMPPQTKNIADLNEFTLDMEIFDREGQDKDQKPFKYKCVIVNDEEYRIPGKVLGDIKEILKNKPNVTKFKVTKKGSGLSTTYTVMDMG